MTTDATATRTDAEKYAELRDLVRELIDTVDLDGLDANDDSAAARRLRLATFDLIAPHMRTLRDAIRDPERQTIRRR
jgi:hypothetical protein